MKLNFKKDFLNIALTAGVITAISTTAYAGGGAKLPDSDADIQHVQRVPVVAVPLEQQPAARVEAEDQAVAAAMCGLLPVPAMPSLEDIKVVAGEFADGFVQSARSFFAYLSAENVEDI